MTRVWSFLHVAVALPLLASTGAAAAAACATSAPDGPTVDLGYARYQGTHNSTTNLNIFRGIRYAAPPTGDRRWKLPQEPKSPSSSSTTSKSSDYSNCAQQPPTPATSNPPRCPWARRSLLYPKTAAEEEALKSFNFTGDEDCLFLNVFAPAQAENLPVVVWIHGGGYSLDYAASYDFSTQISTNNNSYLAVVIQYRLGAFGFLASDDLVANGGVANAGLYDMVFALQWVKQHIGKFGGNPGKVTVAGQSAGGGAVLLLAATKEADGLFNSVIASSPYLTTQPKYNGDRPTKAYNSLAERVGCSGTNKSSSTFFACLQGVDSLTLQNASDWVSTQGRYGQWEWRPVIDGKLLKGDLVSDMSQGKAALNGHQVLTSNVAEEGPYFTWQNITSQETFLSFLQSNYPKLTATNIDGILSTYAPAKHVEFLAAYSKDANNTDPGFSTNGLQPPFATTVSNYATGWQQVANNFYAEATFVCPSYWLANAYAAKTGGRAWRYQFSIPPAYHGLDVGSGSDTDVLLAPVDTPNTAITMPLRRALQNAWGEFIVRGEPTLRGRGAGDTRLSNAASVWPQWKQQKQCRSHRRRQDSMGVANMLNANMTGGVPIEKASSFDGMVTLNITSYVPGSGSDAAGSPPLEAVLDIVDGDAWEDGRGERCRVLAELSPWLAD